MKTAYLWFVIKQEDRFYLWAGYKTMRKWVGCTGVVGCTAVTFYWLTKMVIIHQVYRTTISNHNLWVKTHEATCGQSNTRRCGQTGPVRQDCLEEPPSPTMHVTTPRHGMVKNDLWGPETGTARIRQRSCQLHMYLIISSMIIALLKSYLRSCENGPKHWKNWVSTYLRSKTSYHDQEILM